MASKKEQQRDERIKTFGGIAVRAGEEHLDNHLKSDWVETVEPGTGKKTAYRKDVADRLISKGKAERGGRASFTVPLIPGFNDKVKE